MARIRLDEGTDWSPREAYAKAVAQYRKATGVADGKPVTEDMIDDATLESVATHNGMPARRLRRKVLEYLTEATSLE